MSEERSTTLYPHMNYTKCNHDMSKNARTRTMHFKVDKSTIILIFLLLTKTVQLYSLAIIMIYFLQENNLPELGWFGYNVYMMNSTFCSITLY